MVFCKSPFGAQKNGEGTYNPSPFTLFMATSKTTKYKKQQHNNKNEGIKKPVLVVCSDESDMPMKNGKVFSSGNHPIELFVPLLHFRDAGFTFDITTITGRPVKLEMWAYPSKDKNVLELHEEVKHMMNAPKKLSAISASSLADDYAAIFIPGGHGCMITLPFDKDLGNLLREAHAKKMPTVTLCHGPSTLLASGETGDADFPYKGYEIMCFTDKTDAMTPKVGYLPGHMPWKCQEALESKGLKVLNKKESGKVHRDRELITGDGPDAADNLGKLAAPALLEFCGENK